MAEETQVIETKEIPLGEASMADFKKARADGKESIVKEAAPNKEELEEKSDDEQPDQKAKSRGGLKTKLDRLVKHTASLEEELAATKRELSAKSGQKVEEKQVPEDGEPQRDKFASEADYIRALTRWEVKQEMKAEREAEEKEALVAQQKEAISNYNKKAIEAQSRYEDWNEVMAQDTPLPSIVGDAIVHTIKNGPDVAYYLGMHPEVCEEMLSVHPLEAVAMAVKISEKLAKENGKEEDDGEEKADEDTKKEEVKEEKPKTKAPAPIRPISGATSKSTIPLDKTGDMAYYKKQRALGRVQ